MNRSKATAALQRFKEIDKKYKVRYDESKNDKDSSENTASLLEKKEYKKKHRDSSPLEKREILKPTLSIKIPDTFAEKLDTESATSNDVSPSPRVSVVDKTPVETPRAKSISEIQEVLDEGESISEILEDSNDSDFETSEEIGKNGSKYSDDENVNLEITVENFSPNHEEPKNNYSDDSFENDSSDTESIDSRRWTEKYLASPCVSQKSNIRKNEIQVSVRRTQNNSGFENHKILDNGEISEKSIREEKKIVDRSNSNEELSNSVNVANTPRVESNLRSNTYSTITEKSDMVQQLSESLKIIHSVNEKSESYSSKNTDSKLSEKNGKFKSDNQLSAVHKIVDTTRSMSALNSSESQSNADERENEELSSARPRKSPQSQRGKLEPNRSKCNDSKSSDEFSISEKLSTSLRSTDSSCSKLDTNKAPLILPCKTKSSLSKDRCRVSGKLPDVNAIEMEFGSRRSDTQGRIEHDGLALLSDKQPEVGLAKIVRKAQGTIEIRASIDSSQVVKKRISYRKKRYAIRGDHREPKINRGNLKMSKSGAILRSNETALFERKDRELERLRARISDLHLERERQLLLCYMRDFDEDRKRFVLFSNQFHCPGKPEVSIIKPLEFPKVANFIKPDSTGLRRSFLLPDDNLELAKNRVAEIRQWLKDQFVLYRDYSDVAAAINSKYVTDAAAEKVSRSAVAQSRRETPEVRRYRESSRRQPEVAVGSRPEEAV